MSFDARPPLYAGVDVGGTGIKFGIVDDTGRVLKKDRIDTCQDRGPADAMQRSAAAIGSLVKGLEFELADIPAIGLATPGTMDLPAGMILEPPNLPAWRHFPVRDTLAEITQRPVFYANDATAAAFGEFWVGSGQDYTSILLITLGTGIGAGIIIDGESIDGAHSHGSECGHIIIDISDDASTCSCGQTGHVEAYASATGLVKRAHQVLQERASSVRERLATGETLTPLLLAEEANAGDQVARELILESARYLGIGIVSMVHTIDPEAVILGGAMNFGGRQTELGRLYLDQVRTEFQSRALPVPAQLVKIDFAMLGGDAGFIGAAGMARRWHQQVA